VVENRADRFLDADLKVVGGVGHRLGPNGAARVLRYDQIRTWRDDAGAMDAGKRRGILGDADLPQTRDRWEEYQRRDHDQSRRAQDLEQTGH